MNGRSTILSECGAVACCPPGAPLRSLERFARATGFGLFAHYRDVTELRKRVVSNLFFLVHFATEDAEKTDILHRLRHYPSPRVKLAPIILITQDCDADTFLRYIEMGFDDILCLPENSELLTDRLVSQLKHDIVYIETADYFGPDRRRMEVIGGGHTARVSNAHLHSKLVIHRSVTDGPAIVRRWDYWDTTTH
ncbi:hypothetical protein [Devosia sp. XK-2]|uniref:hypothetical protein n=1 Tax=Devosia sp. XK-2 TaxID=3126689 RepID=UPI0030CBC11F